MPTVSVGTGSRTRVTTIALYKIEQESEGRLVLRAKAIGAHFAGGLLTVMGLPTSAVAWMAAVGDNPVWIPIVAGGLGLLLLAGGIALFRVAVTNRDRIVIDRAAREARFDATDVKRRFSVPFANLEKVEVRRVDKSGVDEIQITFPVYLVCRGGDEFKVDEASDIDQMTELARKIAILAGVPPTIASPSAGGRASQSESRQARHVLVAAGPPPEGLRIGAAPDGTVYAWPMLPRRLGLVVLFSALTLVFLGPALALAAGVVFALGDLEIGSALGYAVGAVACGAVALFFVRLLAGGCRLTLGSRGLHYEEFFLGVKVGWTSRDLPAGAVTGFRVGDPQRGGLEVQTTTGSPFFMKLPVGAGGFSMADLQWMKQRWLQDLGL